MERIRRDIYLRELADRRGNGLIKVVTGIRRCGKSYLLFNIFGDFLRAEGTDGRNVVEVVLDEDENKDLRKPENLSAYVRSRLDGTEGTRYVFIDEAQYAISREDLKSGGPLPLYGVLNGIARIPGVEIYITGSNSRFLSSDVLTEFRGRGDEIRIHPLTFGEYYGHVGGDKADAYEQYALYGGMPLVLFEKTPRAKARYLSRLFREVYLKDISERYGLTMPEVMELLADVLCSSAGSLTNSSRLANTLRSEKHVSADSQTISTYLGFLEESFLFSRADRYDVKGKRYFSYPCKYYCADTGLRNARLNFRQRDESRTMENVIYNELLARGYAPDVGVVETSAKGADGKIHQVNCEIDFVVNDGMNRFYIQSAVNMDGGDREKRELRPLLATGDFFKRIVVTKTRAAPWLDDSGILRIGLYDFLLDRDCLESL